MLRNITNNSCCLPLLADEKQAIYLVLRPQFIVPDWGDKGDYDIAWSHTGPSGYVGWFDNPMPKSNLTPGKGLVLWPLDWHQTAGL
jgi:hypothetical protein